MSSFERRTCWWPFGVMSRRRSATGRSATRSRDACCASMSAGWKATPTWKSRAKKTPPTDSLTPEPRRAFSVVTIPPVAIPPRSFLNAGSVLHAPIPATRALDWTTGFLEVCHEQQRRSRNPRARHPRRLVFGGTARRHFRTGRFPGAVLRVDHGAQSADALRPVAELGGLTD